MTELLDIASVLDPRFRCKTTVLTKCKVIDMTEALNEDEYLGNQSESQIEDSQSQQKQVSRFSSPPPIASNSKTIKSAVLHDLFAFPSDLSPAIEYSIFMG